MLHNSAHVNRAQRTRHNIIGLSGYSPTKSDRVRVIFHNVDTDGIVLWGSLKKWRVNVSNAKSHRNKRAPRSMRIASGDLLLRIAPIISSKTRTFCRLLLNYHSETGGHLIFHQLTVHRWWFGMFLTWRRVI